MCLSAKLAVGGGKDTSIVSVMMIRVTVTNVTSSLPTAVILSVSASTVWRNLTSSPVIFSTAFYLF